LEHTTSPPAEAVSYRSLFFGEQGLHLAIRL